MLEEQAKLSGIFTLIENETRSYNGFNVLFDCPIALKKNDRYKLLSQTDKGPAHGME